MNAPVIIMTDEQLRAFGLELIKQTREQTIAEFLALKQPEMLNRKNLAKRLGISVTTLDRRVQEHPELKANAIGFYDYSLWANFKK